MNDVQKLLKRIETLERRLGEVENENISLCAAMNHLNASSALPARQQAGSALTGAGVSEHCLNHAYIGIHTDSSGTQGIKIGPLRLTWNDDDGVWEGGDGAGLIAGRENAALGAVTDPDASAEDSLVSDTQTSLRAHLSNICFVSDYGLYLNGDANVCLPGAAVGHDVAQLGLVFQDFNGVAPLGDGKTKLFASVAVLI